LSSPIESNRIEITSLEEAEIYIDALERFFSRLERVIGKWYRFKRKYEGEKRFGYTRRHGGDPLEEIIRSTLYEAIEKAFSKQECVPEHRRLSEEQVDRIVTEVKKELEKQRGKK